MKNTFPTRIARRSAFTLVELLVSIAIALLLIYGVNRVFKITSDTVGATNTLGEKTRDARAARQTFANDLNAAVTAGAPFFIIQSEQTYAFRNRADFESDSNGLPASYDATGSGVESAIDATNVSFRSHRIDMLRFFTSALLHRQTDDNNGTYAADSTSGEAVITYGHLRIFDGTNSGPAGSVRTADFFGPNQGTQQTNTNGYYATDWILGRSQLLLSPGASSAGPNCILRKEPDPPSPGELNGTAKPTDSQVPISPVAENSQSTQFNDVEFDVQTSRYDIGDGSMYNVWSAVSRYTDFNAIRVDTTPNGEADWWSRLTYRFWANPYPQRPIDTLQAALTSPIFLRGCTQFIVEFAGDFGDQSGGQAFPVIRKDGHTDGMIDYITDNNGTRRIRWYGFPRDVGSPTNDATFKGGPDGRIEAAWDVLPLRDVLRRETPIGAIIPLSTVPQNWPEKRLPTNTIQANYVGNVSAGAQYVVAFGPRELDKGNYFGPKLIRITLVLDDPTSKLPDGQTYEYIFKLGY